MQDDNTNTNEVAEVVPADEPQTIETDFTSVNEPIAEPVEQVEDEVATETPQEEETSEDKGKEEAPAPSRRETLRIQQLLKKYGPPPETPAYTAPRPNALNYSDALDADPEVIQQLEADRQATGQAQYNEGLKRAEYLNWNTTLKIDAPQVERQFPILNPKSPDFHPAVADSINKWYLDMSGYDAQSGTVKNPNIGYGDFVESFMELVQETAGQKQVQSVKNIAKQAATTGLRPDGSSVKRMNLNQSPDKMTLEELYASIGQKPPK